MAARSVRRGTVLTAMLTMLAGIGFAAPVLAADESVSARVTTAHPTVGAQLTIEGTVTGAPSSPSTVTTTREDSTGTQPVGMPVTTAADGSFAINDTPPARGSVTYHLSADAGAATTDVVATVAGKPTDLSIDVRPAPARAENSVRVTAHLRSATTNRAVSLYAQPYRRSRIQFDSGAVDANGDRTAERTVRRRTTFTAVFAGDSAYAPATAKQTVRVRAVVEEDLKGGFRTSHGTRLYHRNDNPALAVHVLPERKGTCIHFRAQHREHGSWVRSAVSGCVRTDATGRKIGVLQGDHVVGRRYRLRAEWHGSTAVARSNGAWVRLEFR